MTRTELQALILQNYQHRRKAYRNLMKAPEGSEALALASARWKEVSHAYADLMLRYRTLSSIEGVGSHTIEVELSKLCYGEPL